MPSHREVLLQGWRLRTQELGYHVSPDIQCRVAHLDPLLFKVPVHLDFWSDKVIVKIQVLWRNIDNVETPVNTHADVGPKHRHKPVYGHWRAQRLHGALKDSLHRVIFCWYYEYLRVWRNANLSWECVLTSVFNSCQTSFTVPNPHSTVILVAAILLGQGQI